MLSQNTVFYSSEQLLTVCGTRLQSNGGILKVFRISVLDNGKISDDTVVPDQCSLIVFVRQMAHRASYVIYTFRGPVVEPFYQKCGM